MQYDYEIQYRKGRENTVVDALSKVSEIEFNSLTTTLLLFDLLDRIEQSCKPNTQL